MEAKEKAKELVSKFKFLTYPESNAEFYNPKQCALIAVDEIIEAIDWHEYLYPDYTAEYWKQVKYEIEKL
jgi:hypothetical protein